MTICLVSEWHLAAPLDAVWAVLDSPETWPLWWPQIRHVETLKPGDKNDEGSVRRTWWTSRLPYELVLDLTTRAVEKPLLIVVEVGGNLHGMGRWELTAIPVGTRVRCTWQVVPHKTWMRLFSPFFVPLLNWNHHVAMRAGALGMANHLGVEMIDYRSPKENEA